MKNKILTLIIGILLGAIITTAVFLIIKSNSSNEMPNGFGGHNMNENGMSERSDNNSTDSNETKNDDSENTESQD